MLNTRLLDNLHHLLTTTRRHDAAAAAAPPPPPPPPAAEEEASSISEKNEVERASPRDHRKQALDSGLRLRTILLKCQGPTVR